MAGASPDDISLQNALPIPSSNPIDHPPLAPNLPAYHVQHFPVPGNQPGLAFQLAQFNPDQPVGQPVNPQPYIIYHYPQPRYMPSRYDMSAPKFDGHPRSLKRFFEEIEMLARECTLSPKEQIVHTLRYLEGPDYDVWTIPPSAAGNDWLQFKIDIIAMYPGAEDDEWYSVTDLELLVERHAAKPMRDKLQFGEYLREFVTRATWLLDRKLISQRERNKLFISGFHIDFRQQLRTQLRIQDPRHPINEPWDPKDVEEAARFLLQGASLSDYTNLAASSQVDIDTLPLDAFPNTRRGVPALTQGTVTVVSSRERLIFQSDVVGSNLYW